MVINCCLIKAKAGCFSVIEGNSTNTCIHASPSLLLKHHEPQPLPIIPIGIVAYTLRFRGTTFVKIAVFKDVKSQKLFYSFHLQITMKTDWSYLSL